MSRRGDSTGAGQAPVPVAADMPINLGQFVKLAGLAATGGAAKQLVVSGGVRVNGQPESRRGRKLLPGDVVEAVGGAALVIERSDLALPSRG